MQLNNKNKKQLEDIFFFCKLYELHRDFIMYRNISKCGTLSWEQAESIASFCNMLVQTKVATPTEFIKTEDTQSNDVIDRYKKLKDFLLLIKVMYGYKKRDQIYKAVKRFHRKKTYCYQMDNYFTNMIFGFYEYTNGNISMETFLSHYYFEISLFNGVRKTLELKKVIKIYQNIKEHLIRI